MTDHDRGIGLPDRIWVERDEETNEKRWYSIKGMGVEYVRADVDATASKPVLAEAWKVKANPMGADGLDERAFDAARKAFHKTALGEYGTLRAAISAYLEQISKPQSAFRAGRHALELAEGRLSLLLETFPDESEKIDHPSATRYILGKVRAALSTPTQPVKGEGGNAEEPEAWIIRCKGWGEELSFTEAGAKELAAKLENIPGVKKATITPLYARPNKGGDGKDDIPAPAEHLLSVEAVGDPEAWLFHEAPHRPQTIDPRWMSITQINKHIAALEGELRARAAVASHPCTSTPVVSQNVPDLEDKPCGIADPTTRDCPNMKEVGGGMDGERYRCAVCGKGYYLDYEEMK